MSACENLECGNLYCILNEKIALRSWVRSPYAYYMRERRDAERLKKEEYDLLKLCDGEHDLEESILLKKLIMSGFVKPCKKGEYKLSPWQDKTYDNRYFPAMNWMITGKCNYNCLHCFNAADNAPLQSEWSLEEANNLLDQARDCGINGFTITGGEPMLHKNFFEILEGIYNRDMYVFELNTNGHFINQESLDRMKKIGCVPLMKISFDGIGWHDWLRNKKGAEDDALRAISLCVENGFPVKVQANVHRKNVDVMLDTVRMLDKMGVKETRVIRTTEAPRWEQNADGATLTFKEYMDAMLELWDKYSHEEHKMDLTAWQIGSMMPKNKCYLISSVECASGEYRPNAPVCKGNRGMIAVAANGNVFPCHQMSGYYEQHNDVLGNLKKDSLKELISGGRYMDEICTTVGTLREVNEKCGKCKYYEYCCGGCRAIALALTGDKMASDPSKCFFFENGYYDKIVKIMDGWHNLTVIKE